MNGLNNDVRQSPAFLLWRVSNAWQRAIRRVLEPWDLTHTQFAVLSSVERLGAATPCVCQVEVARWLDIDENMTSQVVRSLERRGLVLRKSHPTDRRAHRLALTQEGEDIVTQARSAVMDVKAVFFEQLGDREGHLVELLKLLVDCPSE